MPGHSGLGWQKARGLCKLLSMEFHGAKLAILVGDKVVSILRDDIPGLDFAGHWDLPGGGREGGETPEACALRELREELGVTLQASDLDHGFACQSNRGTSWFFVSKQPDFDPAKVHFGDEGQGWTLGWIDWFLNEARAIPVLKRRLSTYLEKGHPCA